MAMALRRVTHCIFNLDGTILDTKKIQFEAIDTVLRQFDRRHTLKLCRKIADKTPQESSKIIVEYAKLKITPQEFLERVDVIRKSLLVNSISLPGAKELIRHLHKHGIPTAIETSDDLATTDIKCMHHQDLESWLSHVVSETEDPQVLAVKPAPDVFLVTAQRFDPPPDPKNCLVFEDTPKGVRAAFAAGMQAVMIPDPKMVTLEYLVNPTVCFESLCDFKPEQFGLPAFGDDKSDPTSCSKRRRLPPSTANVQRSHQG